jgi:hypothetical protein
MADIKISALPSDASPTVTDKVPMVDTETSTTKRVLISDLITLFFNNIPSTPFLSKLIEFQQTQNMLINGNMEVWQRNTSASPNDDVYTGADRWNMLTETNGAWTVAREATEIPTSGSRYSMKCSNVTLNNQMGIVQILEAKDAYKLIGGVASLSFYAKTNGTEIAKLRAAILSWSSTEDVVTSDVIGTWAQNGTNPTWATNWTAENAPSDLSLTSSWQRFTIENVAIDTASAKNIAVVIWVDDGTIAAGDDFYIAQVELVAGAKAFPSQPRNHQEELARCQRYYQDYAGGAYRIYHNNVHRNHIPFSVTMRVSPTTTKTLSGSGIQADNTSALASGLVYDTQFTGGGTGVIDATYTVLNFAAEM